MLGLGGWRDGEELRRRGGGGGGGESFEVTLLMLIGFVVVKNTLEQSYNVFFWIACHSSAVSSKTFRLPHGVLEVILLLFYIEICRK